MKVNAIKGNITVKEKPVVAPKPHRSISRTSTTPVSHSGTLPHHSSSNSFVSPSTTIHQCAENQSRSKNPYQHADLTASLPHSFKPQSYVEHSVSNRHTVSPHSKNASTNLNHSSPPKVNYI